MYRIMISLTAEMEDMFAKLKLGELEYVSCETQVSEGVIGLFCSTVIKLLCVCDLVVKCCGVGNVDEHC